MIRNLFCECFFFLNKGKVLSFVCLITQKEITFCFCVDKFYSLRIFKFYQFSFVCDSIGAEKIKNEKLIKI